MARLVEVDRKHTLNYSIQIKCMYCRATLSPDESDINNNPTTKLCRIKELSRRKIEGWWIQCPLCNSRTFVPQSEDYRSTLNMDVFPARKKPRILLKNEYSWLELSLLFSFFIAGCAIPAASGIVILQLTGLIGIIFFFVFVFVAIVTGSTY